MKPIQLKTCYQTEKLLAIGSVIQSWTTIYMENVLREGFVMQDVNSSSLRRTQDIVKIVDIMITSR